MKIEQPKWKWTSVFSRKKPRHRKSRSYLQLSPPTKSRNRAKVKSGVTPKTQTSIFFLELFFQTRGCGGRGNNKINYRQSSTRRIKKQPLSLGGRRNKSGSPANERGPTPKKETSVLTQLFLPTHEGGRAAPARQRRAMHGPPRTAHLSLAAATHPRARPELVGAGQTPAQPG